MSSPGTEGFSSNRFTLRDSREYVSQLTTPSNSSLDLVAYERHGLPRSPNGNFVEPWCLEAIPQDPFEHYAAKVGYILPPASSAWVLPAVPEQLEMHERAGADYRLHLIMDRHVKTCEMSEGVAGEDLEDTKETSKGSELISSLSAFDFVADCGSSGALPRNSDSLEPSSPPQTPPVSVANTNVVDSKVLSSAAQFAVSPTTGDPFSSQLIGGTPSVFSSQQHSIRSETQLGNVTQRTDNFHDDVIDELLHPCVAPMIKQKTRSPENEPDLEDLLDGEMFSGNDLCCATPHSLSEVSKSSRQHGCRVYDGSLQWFPGTDKSAKRSGSMGQTSENLLRPLLIASHRLFGPLLWVEDED
jgi:hypothetical protein